jgi:hypothetical protein
MERASFGGPSDLRQNEKMAIPNPGALRPKQPSGSWILRLAATAESAPLDAGLTDLESFFRLVDAAGFLTCHVKIRSDLEKDSAARTHAQVVYVFTFSQ